MGKTTIWVVCGLTCLMAVSCASREDRIWLETHYHGRAAAPPSDSLSAADPLYGFVRSVAGNGNTQENTISGQHVRGVYSGEHGGCRHVAVLYLDAPSKRDVRADDYRVCGSQISKINGEVTPSYPDQADALSALSSARRNGLLYGQQTAWFQNYAIDTRRLGIAGSRPCLPVETRITYEGRLVLHDVKEVCN